MISLKRHFPPTPSFLIGASNRKCHWIEMIVSNFLKPVDVIEKYFSLRSSWIWQRICQQNWKFSIGSRRSYFRVPPKHIIATRISRDDFPKISFRHFRQWEYSNRRGHGRTNYQTKTKSAFQYQVENILQCRDWYENQF